MRRQYALVEDIIREEMMMEYHLRREIRQIIFEEMQRLDEGKIDGIIDVIRNWPKLQKALSTAVSYCTNMSKFKKLLNTIRTVTSGNPGKIVKWLLKGKTEAKLVKLTTKEQKQYAKAKGLMGEYVCDCAGYWWDKSFKDDFNSIKTTVGLLFNTIKTAIGFFKGIGTIIEACLDVVESVISDIFDGIRDFKTIIWNALNTVIKSLIGFDLDDVAEYASKFAKKVYKAIFGWMHQGTWPSPHYEYAPNGAVIKPIAVNSSIPAPRPPQQIDPRFRGR